MHPHFFGMFLLFYLVQFATSQCSNGQFSCIVNPTEPGRRFPDTVFMTFEKFGPNQCFDECIRRARCESFNYKASEFYCELNTGYGEENNTNNDFINNAKYEYTSMNGLRKTFYDPCIYASGCYPGTVCGRHGDGTRRCEIEDETVYQNYLESIAVTTPEGKTTEVTTPEGKTTEVTTPEGKTTEVTTPEGKTTEVTTAGIIESTAVPKETTEVNKTESGATTMDGSNLTEVTTTAVPRPKK